MKVIAIPCGIYEAAYGVTISDAYCCDSSEVDPDGTRP